MDNKNFTEQFKQALQHQLDSELDARETFPPHIREQIRDVYKKMWEEKLAWEKEQQKKEELP